MKIILTVGVSGSGKTTWVNSFLKEKGNENYVNINRDDIRFTQVAHNKDISNGYNWKNYKFSKENEKKVTEIVDEMAIHAVNNNQNIIISDTNLNPKNRQKWQDFANKHGYELEFKTFDVPYDKCVKHDLHRLSSVGERIIYSQYQNYLDFIKRKTYTPDESKPNAIIVDIDGTVATMNERSAFEWGKVGEDSPRKFIIDLIESYVKIKTNNGNDKANEIHIIFLSGRDSVCRQETLDWLKTNLTIQQFSLFMRKENDMRKDSIIKEELFWSHVEPNYNVIGLFDDRPQVIRLWHELKIPNIICVGNPYLEF